MARPRKPTAVHMLTGAMEHNPARFADRANEPRITTPLGPPREGMEPEARAAWHEIERLAPWLTQADRLAVEMAACLLVQFRVAGVRDMPPQNMSRLETLLGRLGLTPSDRSKVAMPAAPARENPFHKFINRGKGPW